MPLIKTFPAGKLDIRVYDTREEAGKDAAKDGAAVLRKLLADPERPDGKVNVIFAAAPSQNDTLASLEKEEGIDWSRVRAFHMDEYVGFGRERKESFGSYLYEHVFSKLPFGEVHYLRGDAPDPEAVPRGSHTECNVVSCRCTAWQDQRFCQINKPFSFSKRR